MVIANSITLQLCVADESMRGTVCERLPWAIIKVLLHLGCLTGTLFDRRKFLGWQLEFGPAKKAFLRIDIGMHKGEITFLYPS